MMSLPSIQLPSNNPPSPASTADSSEAPRTPEASNGNPMDNATANRTSNGNSAAANNKNNRKPSRRANTAERRATHNAVERQRRETLNGRFLDLAALLPNLSQIRRPSKSSIVNSSIAHVHASRRHRLLASRELRLMKMEADALRRELNEWRDRAGIPRVEEPQRGDGFGIVLSGELEVVVVPTGMDDEDDGDYAGYPDEEPADYPQEQPQQFAPPHMRANVNIPSMHPQQMLPSPMIASPTSMTFENPAMGYAGPQPFYAQHPQAAMLEEREREREKWFIAQQQQQMMNGRMSSARRPRSGSMSSGSTGSPPLTANGGYIPESARYGGGSPGSYEGSQAWIGGGGGGGGMNNAVFAMMM